ncbi:MAG: class I SAM-dependent RNA methyltransferase [Parvibaculaceae bacterium]
MNTLPTDEIDITIDSLGHLGDGVADVDGAQVFVPLTLAGERVTVRLTADGRADLLRILEPSASRIKPPCNHFGQCGGCALQHIEPSVYAEWKREQVIASLSSRGIDVEVDPLVTADAATRRRATFAATRTKKGVMLGYYGRASHNIIAIERCPLITPEIEESFARLAEVVAPGLSRKGRASILVTSTETGLDVAVTGGKEAPDGALRSELAQRAAAADLARLTWDGDMISERRAPVVSMSGIKVTPPPGAFLQATQEGQDNLVALVLEGVGDAKRVVDLFSGCGTFTSALAVKSSVLGVESEPKSILAIDRAIREQGPAKKLKPVAFLTRDLFRRPLHMSELLKVDAVVFDPPRAGAAAQCEMLAQSSVPVIVGVSCNPATFARDARTLIDGGYRLTRVTPVDQFLWSPHIELVGVFTKGDPQE